MAIARLTAVLRGVGTPDVRTRSVWLTQLVLAASVVITNVLVLAIRPDLFGQWSYSLGTVAIITITVVTLAVPWARLAPHWVLAVPFADAIAIGFIGSGVELRFGFFWIFPVLWVAMHFRPTWLAAMLALISVILLVDSAFYPASGTAALRVFIVVLSLSSLGITAYLSLRRTRALGRLLGRQADRLNATLRRRSDQERRTTEILNGVDTGIARLSTDGTLLTVNDTYSRLYGLDPQNPSLPARSVEYTSFQGMPIPISQRPFARAGRGETFTDASVWLFTPEGEWRALSITAKRLRGTVDEEPSMLLVVQDVTAITQAQRERDQLTAMASHELKHPLTVMIGNAELALELDELTPRTRHRFQTILSASERMLEMTNNMLAVSRGELSSSHDAKEIDLRPILLDSVASFQPTAISNEVQLEARIDDRLPVTADGFRLRQAVDNLVSNAIKYTPRDGQVRVVAEADRESITLTIADTGIGIAENDLRNIMTPYFRTAAAKETAGGTGLGLGITNEIVAAHGGTLTMESAPGVGTTVAVRLPRAREDARAGAERHS